MSAGTPRGRNAVLALAAALVVVFGVARWRATEQAPVVPAAPLPTPLPSVNAPEERATGTARPLSVVPSATSAPDVTTTAAPRAEGSPSSRPTPPVFDLGRLPRSQPSARGANDEDRFPTTDWFTQEDQRHPERYFELAARMPELNRPEERRHTLQYFEAYRAKLQRDLEAAREDTGARQDLLATAERYDRAISRLRKLIEGERPQ
jgi:hypothetical protein